MAPGCISNMDAYLKDPELRLWFERLLDFYPWLEWRERRYFAPDTRPRHILPLPEPARSRLRKSKGGPFRFLDLPGELRNLIYEKVVTLTTSLVVRYDRPCPLPLMRVCRQTRDELISFLDTDLYSPEVLEVVTDRYEYSAILDFLERAKPWKIDRLHTLRLTIVDRTLPQHERRLLNPLLCADLDLHRPQTAVLSPLSPTEVVTYEYLKTPVIDVGGRTVTVHCTIRRPEVRFWLRDCPQAESSFFIAMDRKVDCRLYKALHRDLWKARIVDMSPPQPPDLHRLITSESKRPRQEAWLGWVVGSDERKGKRRRADESGQAIFIGALDQRYGSSDGVGDLLEEMDAMEL